MTPFVLAAVLVLQQPVAQRPVVVGNDSAQAVTRQAISDVGRGVGEARSAHELLRRAVFNGSDGQVVERARQMQQRCRELVTIVQSATRRVCLACFSAAAQRAIGAYRAGLPSVGQVGTRCANQLRQDLSAHDAAAAARASIRVIGAALTSGLLSYEAKLLDVRRAFGLVPPASTPVRRP